jgi:hypothetical protein
MKIVLTDKKPYLEINYETRGLGKYSFKLIVKFNTQNNQTNSVIELGGDLNPFIFKMAEKPLMELVVSMNKKLSELKL